MRGVLLFAYGTLLTGTGNDTLDRLLRKNLIPLESATIQGRVIDLGRYPGAVPTRNGARLSGTLLRVLNPVLLLRIIDRYEDYDRHEPRRSEFVRRRVSVQLNASGRNVPAWVYWYRGSGGRLNKI